MYSPKISEELVPVLYRLAKDRKTPMTRLVDGLIRQALISDHPLAGEPARVDPSQGNLVSVQSDASASIAEPRPAVAA